MNWEAGPAAWMPAARAVVDEFRFEPGRTWASTAYAPLVGGLLYLAILAVIRATPGKPVRSRALEVAHNAFMVSVSACVMVGTAWAAVGRAREDGLIGLFCVPPTRPGPRMWDGALGFFVYLFYLFKYYELLDTVILSLRRKPLLPLHVYHHVSMPLVCYLWFRLPWLEGSAWCALINSAIHVAMYWYYLQTVLQRRVWWKKYLTSLQIAQFISGAIWVLIFLGLRANGHGCQGNVLSAAFSFAVNLSFIVLFANFFRSTYKPKATPAQSPAPAKKTN
mmetsp:Transcript_34300/g.84125  ORF Transcript_34300/g.84125 Transcript_34300/m.84125 type:complete len:278 (-) Transcript_34300:238-1071(-)